MTEDVGVPKNTQWRIWLLYWTVAGYVVFISYTEPLNSDSIPLQLMMLVFQVFLLLVILILFFMFTANMTYVKLGLYDLYFKEFRIFLIASTLMFAMTLGTKLHQMVLLYNYEVVQTELWDQKGFYELFVLQRILIIFYLSILMYSSRIALQPRLYTQECVFKT
eukprot:TRINITY_DN24139_c0_g1_i1.p1 TRINITY_DN24139_c0_g1~~TRINITY_DN24139_c0_g1_i1.p1  ORF type:complete len:164 (-),score=5.70 TRINITY_DN24139_c0_g1_i1:246-737(-)